jgi:Salmonella virulence plasmid 65kDa B protein
MVDAAFELVGASVDELGVDHVINVEPYTGAAAVSVPIPVTEGRYGFGPDLELSYVAGAGDSPFGIGWSLRYASVHHRREHEPSSL